MVDAATQGRYVLGGILPGRKDRLDRAMRTVKEEFFAERAHVLLWKMIQRMYDQTGTVLTRHGLATFMRNANPAAVMQMESLYDALVEMDMDDGEFITAMNDLKSIATEAATGEMLTTALTILRQPTEVDKQVYEGHEDARAFLASQITVIERDMQAAAAPEGFLRAERQRLLDEYERRKQERLSGGTHGVQLGIANIDAKLGGMQRGELVLTVGYSSDGKSSLCVQAAWSAAVQQKKNVVFFTTETLRDQILNKLMARHSKQPLFGLADGLNSDDIKHGRLKAIEEKAFVDVVNDFTTNENYGEVYLAQCPPSSTMSMLDAQLRRIAQGMQVDLVIMDYLALLTPENRRQSDREQLASILKIAKQTAVTFQDGLGVPLMSPWQVSRTARDKADKEGDRYTSAALAETSEATNSADKIISILRPLDDLERHSEVTAQILKNRDGERADALYLDVDYATSWFSPKSSLSGAVGSFGPAATTAFNEDLTEGIDF